MIVVNGGETKYYYHFDGLGSVVALSDNSGNIVEKYSYDVFGAATIRDSNNSVLSVSSVANPYMFTARAYDSETGLYYYRARYYSPDIGRFLQTDPVGHTTGLNLYTYCGNNPLNWSDPYGLRKGEPWYVGIMDSTRDYISTTSIGPLVGLGPEGLSVRDAWEVFALDYSRAGQGVVNVFTGGLFNRESGIFYNTFNRQWENLGCENNVDSASFRSGETGARVAEAFLLIAAVVEGYERSTNVRIEVHLFHISKTTGKLYAGPHLQGITPMDITIHGDTVWRFGFHPW
jgi:RHS repeat-associated protein